MVLASRPAVFWTTFIDFRRPLEKDGFWTAVYYTDGFWTAVYYTDGFWTAY